MFGGVKYHDFLINTFIDLFCNVLKSLRNNIREILRRSLLLVDFGKDGCMYNIKMDPT